MKMEFVEYNNVLIPRKKSNVIYVQNPSGKDDSELIQNALKEGAGGLVILPEYHYKVSRTIYIPKHTIFQGFGLNSRIDLIDSKDLDEIPFRTHTSTNNKIKPIITNERPDGVSKVKGVQIKNILVTGNGVVETTETRLGGIVFADAENCHTNMAFVNYINWSESDNINKKGFGLTCVRSVDCSFDKGMLDHAGYECFGIYDDCSNITATNMVIKNGMRCSAQIHQNVNGVIFSNNFLMLEKGGSYTNGCFVMHGREQALLENILISNNQMKSSVEDTVLISTIEYQKNVSIISNTLKGIGKGIKISGDNYNFQIKNNSLDVDDSGIDVLVSLFGLNGITGNNIRSRESAIKINRTDTLNINGNEIESDGYGMRIDIVNVGVLIDGNILETVDGSYYGSTNQKDSITLGTNLEIDK